MKHSVKVAFAKSANDLKPIRLRVSFNSYRVDLATGLSYEEKNFKNGKAKNNTMNANRQTAMEINFQLSKMIEVIDNYFIKCHLENRSPLPDELRTTFNKAIRNKISVNNQSVFPLFDEFLKHQDKEKQLSFNCLTNYNNVKRNLEIFDKDLTINDIKPDFLNIFKDFLEKKNLKHTTIRHILSMLKTFLNYLKSKHYINIDIEQHSVVKVIKGDTQSYLTHSELKRLYERKSFDSDTEVLARDMFVFACFTGLRYSDLTRLKKSDINPQNIEFITKKTGTKVSVDLNRYAKEIIDKYLNINPLFQNLFPPICLKHYNNMLHKIFKDCGFDNEITLTYYKRGVRVEEKKKKYEILSSHSARRTFVVECLRKGIAPLIIIRWTGHRSLDTLKPYIAIADETKKSEMTKLDENL